jgi:hypothetical protein
MDTTLYMLGPILSFERLTPHEHILVSSVGVGERFVLSEKHSPPSNGRARSCCDISFRKMCVLQVYSRLSSTPCNTSRQLRNDKSTERSFAFIFLIDLCPSSVGLVWTFLFLFCFFDMFAGC